MWQRFRAVLSGLFSGPREMFRGLWPSTSGEAPRPNTEGILEAYESTPWLRAVAGKVSWAVATTTWRLYVRRDRGGRAVRDRVVERARGESRRRAVSQLMREGSLQEIADHPFLDALEAPNAYMGKTGLLKITQQHLDLVGDAFWLKERNALGVPVGYWPVPPHWVMDTPTPMKPVYRISYRSWQVEVPAADVVRFTEHAPRHPYTRGSGIGWALGDEVQVDEYAAKMASSLFYNRARPDFVFLGGEGTSADDLKRLERDWLNRTQGFFRAGRPYFLQGAGNLRERIYEFNQPTMEQLVYPNLRKTGRDIIVQTWGMPPEMLGIIENSNRATIEAAEYLFAKWVVDPRCEAIRDVLMREFQQEFDERGLVDYDSHVPADKAYRLDVAKAAPHSMTVDEWRAMQGLPPAEDAEVGAARMIPLNSRLTDDPLAPAPAPAPNALPPGAGN